MSVAVCRTSFADILMPSAGTSSSSMTWLLPPRQQEVFCEPSSFQLKQKVDEDDRPGQLDIWTSIQSKKAAAPAPETAAPPYVHPLLRRSSSSLSQKSLEICTESLGSETGSEAFSSSDEMDYTFFSNKDDEGDEERQRVEEYEDEEGGEVKELTMVNYHCSIGRRSSPTRKFPPPLPSISRRDGVPCLSMRPHRRDGRLVVEAVAVPSQNYLQAERHGGRLLLSFINTAVSAVDLPQPQQQQEQQEVEPTDREELVEDEILVEEGEEEEEVEVVERGTVVEVKVKGGAAAKVLRSTLVINKFVGATPVGNQERWAETEQQHHQQRNETKVERVEEQRRAASTSPLRRTPSAISTTAAAATVAETALRATGSGDVRDYGRLPRLAAQHAVSPDTKVLFTSKRRNREELLHNMRRCSQLRRPLFIWEPYCITTST